LRHPSIKAELMTYRLALCVRKHYICFVLFLLSNSAKELLLNCLQHYIFYTDATYSFIKMYSFRLILSDIVQKSACILVLNKRC